MNRRKACSSHRRFHRGMRFEALEDRRVMAVFTVTTTADAGAGSLRQAILDANAMANADDIVFDIPGAGPHVIQPLSPLPDITETVTVDGFTQPGATPNTNPIDQPINADLRIVIDGSLAPGLNVNGFCVMAGEGTILRGMNIHSFSENGIELHTGNNIVSGNFIGTDVMGALDLGNSDHGVSMIGGTGNVIGGGLAATRNLISGNAGSGVRAFSAPTTMITGNFIGTDRGGDQGLGNSGPGVQLSDAPGSNVGSAGEQRNVISGNGADGVFVFLSDNVSVTNNLVGTDLSGAAALPNRNGVVVDTSNDVTVIGNLVSGNLQAGIQTLFSDATTIQGNRVGTDVNGIGPLGNGAQGIFLNEGSTSATVGGTLPGTGNTVAFNAGAGVAVLSGAINSQDNRILRNSTFSNGGLGIDLGDNGPTANDAGDPDDDENLLQNTPVAAGPALLNAGMIRVDLSVDSLPANATYPLRLEIFQADGADEEGQRFIVSSSYDLANFPGDRTVTFPAGTLVTGDVLVVTATDANGNTSEFSAPIIIELAPDAFEVNDTLAQATILGSLPEVTLNGLSIHNATDIDFFKYTAHSTGKLIVNALFTHAVGDLTLRVFDMSGDLIAESASLDDDENLILPVIGQQMYFIQVSGEAGAVNTYDLEIENFPVPTPTAVRLDPASDTGMFNSDQVTNDTTPRLLIQADLTDYLASNITLLTAAELTAGNVPGAGIQVNIVDITTGTETTVFANPVGTSGTLWDAIPPALAEGTDLVSARVR
ncbi:MAG TPA: right-handed parallel beta-helix repeat-containing protein, partial [Pirellulaceae bacterium]